MNLFFSKFNFKNKNFYKYSTDFYGPLDKYKENTIGKIQSKHIQTFKILFTIGIASSN